MTGEAVLAPRALARLAGLLSAIVAAIAAAVALTFAVQVRRGLGFGFDGVPHHVDQAVRICLANARLAVGLGAAAAVKQLQQSWTDNSPASGVARMLAATSRGLDGVVAVVILVNVVPVGLAFGAYGWRMVPALLPHGPFELLAFCIAANLFLVAGKRRISRREWVLSGSATLGLLCLAAALETFAWCG